MKPSNCWLLQPEKFSRTSGDPSHCSELFPWSTAATSRANILHLEGMWQKTEVACLKKYANLKEQSLHVSPRNEIPQWLKCLSNVLQTALGLKFGQTPTEIFPGSLFTNSKPRRQYTRHKRRSNHLNPQYRKSFKGEFICSMVLPSV